METKKHVRAVVAGLLHLHLKNSKWRETMEFFFFKVTVLTTKTIKKGLYSHPNKSEDCRSAF